MIMSFGHKKGLPTHRVSKVFDIRELTHDVTSPAFLSTYKDIVEYVKANPTQNVAIGCEDGKHRSVVMANKVATAARTSVYHRDK